MIEIDNGSNGNGSRSKIAALLPKQIVKVELLTPENESSGVFVVYGPLDGETKVRYDRYLEAGIGRRGSKRSGFDEAISYIFKRKCQEIEGLTADDCGGMEPKEFFLSDPDGIILMKTATNEYLNRSLPSADQSKN